NISKSALLVLLPSVDHSPALHRAAHRCQNCCRAFQLRPQFLGNPRAPTPRNRLGIRTRVVAEHSFTRMMRPCPNVPSALALATSAGTLSTRYHEKASKGPR